MTLVTRGRDSLFKKTFLLQYLVVCLFFLIRSNSHAQQFVKVIGEPPAEDVAAARSVNWIDFDQDGSLDLFVSRGLAGGQNNILYRNDGPPAYHFSRRDSLIVSLDHEPSDGSTWGDYDNDGYPDLFVVNWYSRNNLLYKNLGNGQFTQILSEIPANDHGYSETASWGDYDNDGLIDLFVTNSAGSLDNFLYHNLGGGHFEKITTGAVVTDGGVSRGATWVDYDNDDDLDLFVVNENGQNEFLYRNMRVETGVDSFLRITTGPLVTSGGSSWSASWGDYDNDGDLDVFVTNWNNEQNFLFRNDGNGNFTKQSLGTITSDVGHFATSCWVDYDNDGDLDMFVTTAYGPSASHCFLYKNLLVELGTPVFTTVTGEALTSELGNWYGVNWGDYDEDGDLDVFVAGTLGENSKSMLYRNVGNSNSWLTLDCIGTVSNRSAIGARVRVKAVINGNPFWQMRSVEGQNGYCGQNLQVYFGLGDASVVDSLIIEWPSGLRDVFTNVATHQHLSIAEHDSTPPVLVAPANKVDHLSQGIMLQWKKSYYPAPYVLQVSTESTFTSGIIISDSSLVDTTKILPILPEPQKYYWRIRSARSIHKNIWSEVRAFIVGGTACPCKQLQGWNMVALPLQPNNVHAGVLFPDASSSAYSYESETYIARDSLKQYRAYWLRFSKFVEHEMIGTVSSGDSIPVMAGWNLIGVGKDTVDVSTISSNPAGIVTSRFFEYDGGYTSVTTLLPCKGYWVKADQVGVLFPDTSANFPLARLHMIESGEQPPASPTGESNDPIGIVPRTVELHQNYPNPFNPGTMIEFTLPYSSQVTLEIYNTLGELISTLVNNEMLDAGVRRVNFDASALSSGVYFCKLVATEITPEGLKQNGTIETRKMVVLK